MSKGQRGNKEAKKQKKVRPAVKPALPVDVAPGMSSVAAVPPRKK